MRYQVKFREDALKEWQKLDKTIQQQFAKKLKKCCDNPHIPSAYSFRKTARDKGLLQNKITCVRFSLGLSGD